MRYTLGAIVLAVALCIPSQAQTPDWVWVGFKLPGGLPSLGKYVTWVEFMTSLRAALQDSAADGVVQIGPARSILFTGWRAPATLAINVLYGLPSKPLIERGVMVFNAPVSRAGTDPSVTTAVSDSVLMPLSGHGTWLVTADAGLTSDPAQPIPDGCAAWVAGKLTSTGKPCEAP